MPETAEGRIKVFSGSSYQHFVDYLGAGAYINSLPANYYLHLISELQPPVTGEHNGHFPLTTFPPSRLQLNRGAKVGTIPVICGPREPGEKGVSLALGGLLEASIGVYVESQSSELFRNGTGAVLIGKQHPALLSLGIERFHGLDTEKLATRLGEAEQRAEAMVEAILHSDPIPPHSQHYEDSRD